MVADPYLHSNKGGNRPHYYCFEGDEEGIYWVIPLSSRVEKYRGVVKRIEERHGRCDLIHIAKTVNDRYSVFLIQDMFPITKKYIEREYTLNGKPFSLNRESTIAEINKKAKAVKMQIEHGVKFMKTQPDAMRILKIMLNEIRNEEAHRCQR